MEERITKGKIFTIKSHIVNCIPQHDGEREIIVYEERRTTERCNFIFSCDGQYNKNRSGMFSEVFENPTAMHREITLHPPPCYEKEFTGVDWKKSLNLYKCKFYVRNISYVVTCVVTDKYIPKARAFLKANRDKNIMPKLCEKLVMSHLEHLD